MPLNVGGGDALFFKTGIDPTGVKTGATAIKGILAGLTKNISTMDVFAGLGGGAVIAFAKISAEMYQFSKEFKAAMIDVSTISDEVTKDMEGVSNAILGISRILPQTASQLAKAEYQIISAGITDVAESLDVLKVSAELATAGLTDTFTTADALTSIMNAYGKQAGTAEQISDKLFTTVRLGKINMEQLASQIGMVTGLAAQVGLDFTDLNAAIATGTKTVRPEIFFTALRGFLTNLITPSEDAIKVSKTLGIEFTTAALRAKGLSAFLADLNEKTGGSDVILGKLVPNVRGLIGLLALGADEGRDFNQSYSEMLDSLGSKNVALAKQLEETGNQTKLFWNNLKADLAGFGDDILGIVDSMLAGLNKRYTAKTINEETLAGILSFGNVKGYKSGVSQQGDINFVSRQLKEIGIDTEKYAEQLNKIYAKGLTFKEKEYEISKLITELLNEQIILKAKLAEETPGQAEDKRKAEQEKKIAEWRKTEAEQNFLKAEQAIIDAELAEELAKKQAIIDKELTKKEFEDTMKLSKEKMEAEVEYIKNSRIENENLKNEVIKENKEKLYKLLKDTRKMHDDELDSYLQMLKKEYEAFYRTEEEKKTLIDEIEAVENEKLDRKLKKLDDVSKILSEYSGIADKFNNSLSEGLSILSDMVTESKNLMENLDTKNTLGIISSITSLVSSAVNYFTKYQQKDVRNEALWEKEYAKEEYIKKGGSSYGVSSMFTGNVKYWDYLRQKIDLAVDKTNYYYALLDRMEKEAKSPFGIMAVGSEQEKYDFQMKMKELTDEMGLYLTGTTAESIANGITDGLKSGLSEAELFAQSFESIMSNALNDAFKRTIEEQFLKDWYEKLAVSMASGGELTSGEAWELGNDYRDIIAQAKTIRQGIFGVAGLPGLLEDGGSTSPRSQGISGQIQGITEQTAGVLEGQFNAIRIDVHDMRMSFLGINDILIQTIRIADNTEYLKSIDRKISTNNDILRAMGAI